MGRFRRFLGLEPRLKDTTRSALPQAKPSPGNGDTSQKLAMEVPSKLILIGPDARQLGMKLRSGKVNEAVKMIQKRLELNKSRFGEKHQETASDMYNLSVMLYGQGKLEEAEEMSRQTLKIFQEVLDTQHPLIGITAVIRKAILVKLNKPELNVELFRLALRISKDVHGPEDINTLMAMDSLAEALRLDGEYQEAEGIHRQLLESRMKLVGPKDSTTLNTMNNLAEILRYQGQYVEAEKLHNQGLQLRKDTMGPEHADTLNVMNNLGLVLSGQGKYKEAEEVHRQELELKKKLLGLENELTLYCMVNLTEVLYKQGKFKESLEMHEQAAELSKKALGPEHPSTMKTLNSLSEARRLLNKE